MSRDNRQPQIGILLFKSAGQKMPGDPGHPDTYAFPVAYGWVEGSFQSLVEGSPGARQNLIRQAQALARQGVRAIVGDCGLMGLYQADIANAVEVPVAASSLALIPFLLSTFAAEKSLGIITGDTSLLHRRHLPPDTPANRLIIAGMQAQPHFRAVVMERSAPLDPRRLCEETIAVAKSLAAAGDLGALLLECSNLAPFRYDVARGLNLPVFDINSAVSLLNEAVCNQETTKEHY